MKHIQLFEDFVKKYGQKIDKKTFFALENGKEVLYLGSRCTVTDSDGFIVTLKSIDSGKVFRVNLSMFNQKGAITENIRAAEAHDTINGVQTVIDGKRELVFISTMDKPIYAPNNKKEIKAMNHGIENGLKLIEVKNKKEGNAWVLYKTDKKMAQKLADYAADHGGYLSDSTPDEARYVGNLLGYDKKDIESFVKRIYKK